MFNIKNAPDALKPRLRELRWRWLNLDHDTSWPDFCWQYERIDVSKDVNGKAVYSADYLKSMSCP